MLEKLISHQVSWLWMSPAGEISGELCAEDGPEFVGVFSGSFNPLHVGHRELRAAAESFLGGKVAYELSLHNAEKPSLNDAALQARAQQFEEAILLLSTAPTFLEKSRLWPGVSFLVGFDTAERILDPKFYGHSVAQMEQALAELQQRGCSFLVAGRKVRSDYLTVSDLEIQPEWKPLFRELPEQQFRRDLSSTELRESTE